MQYYQSKPVGVYWICCFILWHILTGDIFKKGHLPKMSWSEQPMIITLRTVLQVVLCFFGGPCGISFSCNEWSPCPIQKLSYEKLLLTSKSFVLCLKIKIVINKRIHAELLDTIASRLLDLFQFTARIPGNPAAVLWGLTPCPRSAPAGM